MTPERPADSAPIAVLDVSEYFGESSGGVRTYLLEKSRHIAAGSTHRHVLVTPGPRDRMVESPRCRWYQLRGPAIPFQPSYRFLLATRSLRRIIRSERPDLIEIGSAYFAPWVVHLARRRHPSAVVWFYHSHLPQLASGRLPLRGTVRRGLARYIRNIGRSVDATFAASGFSAAALESCGVERVVRVTMGVDTMTFTPDRRDARDAVRARLGIDGGPVFGFVGRFAAEKRVADLLAAWPAIERATGGTLVLVGHGPQERELRATAAGRRVVFLPFERDRGRLADLLASLDLYLSAAPHETFGLAVCEALSSGTPVLSADAGAAAELVGESGGGALVPVGDVSAIAATAIRLLDADLDLLGAKARAHVEREHSWAAAMSRLFAAYARVLGR